MKRKIIFLIYFQFCIITFALKLFAQLNTDSLRHILATSTDKEQLSFTYNDYAFQLYRIQPDTAIFYAEKALAIALEKDITTQIYAAYNVIGLASQAKGLYQTSLDYFNKQFDYFTEESPDMAKAYHNIGVSYRFMNNNSASLENELKALKILETAKDSLTMGAVFQSLANLYRDLGDYDNSEKYILRSIDIYSSSLYTGVHSRKSLLAGSYNSYGNLFQMKKEMSKAIKNHKIAIDLYNEAGDLYNKAIGYENLGDDYAKMGDHEEAIANYAIAKEIFRQLNSGTDVGYELYKIADVLNTSGQYSRSHQYADSALALFTANKADSYRLEIYKLKYETYDAENNSASALAFYKKYNELKDSLNVEKQRTELVRLKEEFETTKKEQQIILLETENALKDKEKQEQIVFRNIAIAIIGAGLIIGFLVWNRYRIKQQLKQLQMRNNIASDLHDDVGSTLSSIRMYSDIVSNQIKDKSPESIPVLEKMSNNSKEMIESMSDIVWAIKPSNDLFKNIEGRMFNFATELCNAKNIELIVQKTQALDNLKIPMELRRDLYLIFKEAINNTVKYSACTQLKVAFEKTNSQLIMQIIDNGKGFNTHEVKKGNGLGNMKHRAFAHNGKLDIQSAEGTGTTITFIIPIP
ncbi:MAG: tetratricopeptide repeat protein [Fimbriimonadaceae bacterium]|nr:tetratricopeptide repeat protein [Chitinophagales bacterium]